jgi:hypothetical protein
MISRFSMKHISVSLNILEVEYIADNVTSHEAVWIHKLLSGVFDQELETTLIHCDNQICVKISENAIFHDKSKHNEIKYHFI